MFSPAFNFPLNFRCELVKKAHKANITSSYEYTVVSMNTDTICLQDRTSLPNPQNQVMPLGPYSAPTPGYIRMKFTKPP